MRQYFFTIRGLERVEDDPDGTYLPDTAAALTYAEYTIRELRKKDGWNDPALMMFVQDQARQTILYLPFFRAPKNEPPKEGQEFPFVAAIALTLIARIKQNYCSRSCVRHHYWMETECEPSFHRR